MRFEQQLRSFLTILQAFNNDLPLARFLQQYFRQNKKMGSSDRKSAARLLYSYFRLGNASPELQVEERLFLALFLCGSESDPFLDHFKPELNERISLSLSEKIAFLEKLPYGFKLHDVFPFHAHLSGAVDKKEFLQSFFIQPDLFIRLYSGKEEIVKARLGNEKIPYKDEDENILRLQNGTKLDQLFPDSAGLFEVQDLSSQRTGQFFSPKKYDYWWDACAGSGGKSLLLTQQQREIRLMVSDIRESILDNLDERFSNAGLIQYVKKELDLTKDPAPELHHFNFDGIILDIPCTGSGTWGRTPEMISRFNESAISGFQQLQKTIVGNVVNYLKPGKPLVYITCSVFREENEEIVEFMKKKLGMKLEKSEVLKGYNEKADTMFAARLFR